MVQNCTEPKLYKLQSLNLLKDYLLYGSVCFYIKMILDKIRKYSQIESLRNLWNVYSKRKSLKYGLPFIVFMIGGSFGLREWTAIRYQFSNVKGVTKEEAEKMGLHREREVTLESAYEEIQKLDIDNWENKRGPRPWENNEDQEK